jgi:hypothetical protein
MFSIKEIESQFDSEWVLVEDPQTNETLEILGGKMALVTPLELMGGE